MAPRLPRRRVGGAVVSCRWVGCCQRRWGFRQCQLCCQTLGLVGLACYGGVVVDCWLELGVSVGGV